MGQMHRSNETGMRREERQSSIVSSCFGNADDSRLEKNVKEKRSLFIEDIMMMDGRTDGFSQKINKTE